MTHRHTLTIVFVAALCLVTASDTYAQMFVPIGRDTLRGLPGIEVQTEPFEPDIERDGLARATVQADVVQRLQSSGVTVYPSQRANPSDAKPYLYVLVNSVQIPGQAQYAINLQVHVRQTLRSLIAP